jgi:hypothetical protein
MEFSLPTQVVVDVYLRNEDHLICLDLAKQRP